MLAREVSCEWTRVTDAAQEPVSLDEVKLHAGVTDVDSDGMLDGFIRVAREAAEQHMGRGLFTQTWKAMFSDWAHVLPLPMAAPLQSVASVKYYDAAGALQTLETSVYDTDLLARPGRVVLKPDQTWPELQSSRLNGRVEITYVVGWSSLAAIPERIKQGIRMYVAYLDLDRAGLTPGAQEARRAAERCWEDRIDWVPPSC